MHAVELRKFPEIALKPVAFQVGVYALARIRENGFNGFVDSLLWFHKKLCVIKIAQMKGTSFQRPLKFKVEVNGEAWHQGDAIDGTLEVKNHGSEPTPVSEIAVHLAYGEIKKVRAKSPDAFEILSTATMSSDGPLNWQFQTERNCPITDKSGSLFILYGRGSATEQLGQLRLTVQPFPLIQEFLDTFKVQFRFVVKSQKAATKDGLEAKLAPPDSKAFAMLDYVTLGFRFDGDDLHVHYKFSVKKIEASAASIETSKKKKEVKQTLTPLEYRTSTGRVNHERIETAIREALSGIESKVIF